MGETAEIPPVQLIDKVDDIPVVVPRQILPMAQTVRKTIGHTVLQVIVEKTTDDSAAAAQHQSTRHKHNHSKRAMQQDEGRRDLEGRRNEKEGEAEVKNNVTGWTVVTRNKKQRKMVQIFVRVNGSKDSDGREFDR